jgi:hypothetical protein
MAAAAAGQAITTSQATTAGQESGLLCH